MKLKPWYLVVIAAAALGAYLLWRRSKTTLPKNAGISKPPPTSSNPANNGGKPNTVSTTVADVVGIAKAAESLANTFGWGN